MDFIKSTLLALDRIGILPLITHCYLNCIRVFTYDIESDGTLTIGVEYPAVNGAHVGLLKV